MSLIYKIKSDQNTEPVEMNAYQIMQQVNQALQGSDKQIIAVTPDGTTAQVTQGGKQYTVPMSKIIAGAGLQLASALPPSESAAFDMVNPKWRYAISNLEDDAQRRAYLQAKVQEIRPGAEITGGGRDWYMYDAQSGKWQGLTNSPDFDLADLSEIGTVGARIAGGIAGAVGGGFLGAGAGPVGALAGASVGSGGGTALAETATRGLASLDPDYRNAFDMNKAVQAGAISTGVSAAMPGVAKGIGAVGSKLLHPAIKGAAQAPVSTAMQLGGKTAEGVGNVAQISKLGASVPGKTAGAILTPGINTITGVGALAQVPALLTRGANWAAGKLGVKGAQAGAEEGAEGVLQRLGSWAGGKFSPAPTSGAGGGINLNPAGGLAKDVAAKQSMQQAGGEYGRSLGQGFDAAAKGGQSLMAGAEEAFGALSRGLSGVGQRVASGGQTLQRGAAALRPYEPAILAQTLARAGRPYNLQSMELPSGGGGLGPNMPLGGPRTTPIQAPYTMPYVAPQQGGYLPGYMPYDLEI
jgi:hypothetical protein